MSQSKAENFEQFCKLMTAVAENQLDFHRPQYYKLCRGLYSKITDCYANPRQTNEESDKCANGYRQVMSKLQVQLNSDMMNRCQWLEKCTDTCKNQEDMTCINKCGNEFMEELQNDFHSQLIKAQRANNIL